MLWLVHQRFRSCYELTASVVLHLVSLLAGAFSALSHLLCRACVACSLISDLRVFALRSPSFGVECLWLFLSCRVCNLTRAVCVPRWSSPKTSVSARSDQQSSAPPTRTLPSNPDPKEAIPHSNAETPYPRRHQKCISFKAGCSQKAE